MATVRLQGGRQVFAIRPATAADAEAIARLSAELGYPSATEAVVARLGSVLQEPEHAAYVAVKGERVIGWVHVFVKHLLESDPEAEIGGLVVAASHQRSGAGRTLMERAEAWARAKGLRSVYLRTNVVRKDAHTFYTNLGYQLVKTQFALRKSL